MAVPRKYGEVMEEKLRKVTVVARERGINPKTIHRWAAKPDSMVKLVKTGSIWFVDVTTLPGAQVAEVKNDN